MSSEQDFGKVDVQQHADQLRNALSNGISPIVDAAGSIAEGALDIAKAGDKEAIMESVKGLQASIRALVDESLRAGFGGNAGATNTRQSLEASIQEFRRTLEASIRSKVAEVEAKKSEVHNVAENNGVGASDVVVNTGAPDIVTNQNNIVLGEPENDTDEDA